MKKQKNFAKTIEKLKTLNAQQNRGIIMRQIKKENRTVYISYISEISDRSSISDNIIVPIINFNGKTTIEEIYSKVIYVDELTIDDDDKAIMDYLLTGFSVIIIPDEEKYIIANTQKIKQRDITTPQIESTLRGSKDAFIENLDSNISLLRYRIKDEGFIIDKLSIGKRSKTQVAITYIKDIVNTNLLKQVKEKLKSIEVDGIVESAYIQKFLVQNVFDIFPQTGSVERSDTAAANILEGKICIFVEGSSLAIIIPKTFVSFFDSADDHYENIYFNIFSKLLRFVASYITLTLSSLYVAVVSFHTEILPPQYILALANSRIRVPFNAVIEATLMEIVAEILREASIRLPRQIGPAIGIVGTIVIGQASVAAGLVSPLMVIIVSLTTMCSFIFPDYKIINSIRILKFFMIAFTAIWGLFGFVIGLSFINVSLASKTSFGVPYLSPIAPLNLKDLKDYILSDINLSKRRPDDLSTKDKVR